MERFAGRVAVVDDEENIRETVGYALKREGYRVDLYPDGLAAWEKFGRELPDVVRSRRNLSSRNSCRVSSSTAPSRCSSV